MECYSTSTPSHKYRELLTCWWRGSTYWHCTQSQCFFRIQYEYEDAHLVTCIQLLLPTAKDMVNKTITTDYNGHNVDIQLCGQQGWLLQLSTRRPTGQPDGVTVWHQPSTVASCITAHWIQSHSAGVQGTQQSGTRLHRQLLVAPTNIDPHFGLQTRASSLYLRLWLSLVNDYLLLLVLICGTICQLMFDNCHRSTSLREDLKHFCLISLLWNDIM